jgi:hypothetical protein
VGSKDSPVSPSSDSDSSDYSSDDSDDSDSETPEPSPLPTARPQAPIEAVKYDTMKSVWLPRNVYAESESIRAGLKDFWEVIKTIRDRWKMDSDAVKQAAEAKKDSELPLLKERVDKQRDMIEAALKTAIEYGHHDVLRSYVSILLIPVPMNPSQDVPTYVEGDCLMCERCNQDRASKRQSVAETYLLLPNSTIVSKATYCRTLSRFASHTEISTETSLWLITEIPALICAARGGLENNLPSSQKYMLASGMPSNKCCIPLRSRESRSFYISWCLRVP